MEGERIKPYEILRQVGFIKSNRVSLRAIENAPIGMIIDTCAAIGEATIAKTNPGSDGLFSHSASKALSGGDMPCSGYDCRRKNINSMLQFAALYSDKVYAYNFIVDNISETTSDGVFMKLNFLNDVKLLLAIEPLVASGNIQLTHFGTDCPHCTFEKVATTSTQNNYDSVRSEYIKDFYNNVKFTLVYDDGYMDIMHSGPKSLLYPHGSSSLDLSEDGKQNLIDIAPRVLSEAYSHGKATLSKQVAKKLNLGERFAYKYFSGIAFELGSAMLHNTAYLSNNEHEIAHIRRLTNDPMAQRCTSLLSKHLECVLPFVKSRTPSDLLSIRNNDFDSFVMFRKAFEKAIAEYVGAANELTENTAIMIYQDIVRPEISRLNTVVRNANASLSKDFSRKVMGWSLSLTAGIIGGLVASPIITGLGAFHTIKTSAELIYDYLKSNDGEATIKNDEFYFLWKLHEKSQG